MAQLVPGRPGIGAAFGTGLANTLQGLADAKLKRMIEQPQRESYASALMSILAPEQASSFAQASADGQQQPNLPETLGAQEAQQGIQTEQPLSQQANLARALQQGGLNEQQLFQLSNLALQQKQAAQNKSYQQEKLGLQKESHQQSIIGKPLEEARDKYKTAKKNIDLYNNIIKLAEKGDLRAGNTAQILGKLGLQSFGNNVDTQVAQSLISELAQNAGSAFNTSRLTNLDVNLYKNSLPGLWNTPQGIVAIAKNKILEEEASKARYEALRDEIKESGIDNFTVDRAEERAEPRLKELADQALNNIMGTSKKKSSNEISQLEQEPQGERIDQSIERGLLRTGARVGESLLGLPGDIASLGLGAANYLSGGAIPNYEQIQEKLPVSLPTSQQNREFLRKHTGGYLEPQGKIEEFADEVASDLSTLLLPIKGKIPFKAAIGRALGSNAASFFTKELGGGPLAQAGAKLGVSLLAGLPSMRGKLETTMSEGYDAARKSSTRGTANTTNLSSRARKIYDAAIKGDSPNKDFIKERARAVERIADTGKASITDLTTLKQDLNRQVRENANNLSKSDKRIIGSLLDEVHGLLDKYGRQNKTFGENFKQAEDIYRGLNAQSYVTEVLDKYLTPTNLKNPVVKSILYGAGAFHNPATALKIAGGTLGAREISKTFDLFTNSKEARKYYQEFMEQALKNHGPAAVRAAVKLDETAQDYFE